MTIPTPRLSASRRVSATPSGIVPSGMRSVSSKSSAINFITFLCPFSVPGKNAAELAGLVLRAFLKRLTSSCPQKCLRYRGRIQKEDPPKSALHHIKKRSTLPFCDITCKYRKLFGTPSHKFISLTGRRFRLLRPEPVQHPAPCLFYSNSVLSVRQAYPTHCPHRNNGTHRAASSRFFRSTAPQKYSCSNPSHTHL